MNVKLLFSTFITIFLAEIGDKTQLAAFSLSASSRQPWVVFLGALLGFTCATLIGVWLGSRLGRFLPENYVSKAASLMFVGMGIWIWFKGI